LNSDAFQAEARSTTLSLPVVLYALLAVVITIVSVPFATAVSVTCTWLSFVIPWVGTFTAALLR
jgi:hypothetical protein